MPVAERTKVIVDGIELVISNPEKLYWPDAGITKIEFLQYLADISSYLLPYCKQRYLTTIRYPQGIQGHSFYQKNCPDPRPPFVHTASQGDTEYIHLDSLPTLLWLGNLAALEFHPSFEAIDSETPMEWMIDIDPSREEEPRIMEAAEIVGELLHRLGIASVPKTSGATGVQIVIPIQNGYSFAELRRLGEFFGKYVSEQYPKLFTIERLKKNRGDRIYFDYLQHWPGKTLSAPYTTRARPGAPVSTPLHWEEVALRPDPREFTIRSVPERLREHGDLITRVAPQDLDAVLARI